jgi:hypothetical protein
LAALTALLGVGLAIVGAVDGKAADGESPAHALCPDDANQEPGIQGDVPSDSDPRWDCGVHEIGFVEDAGGAMAVAGHCAYTGGGGGEHATPEKGGVRVIDVSDPENPEVVKVLDTGSRELLAAEVSPDGSRAMLATRHRDTEQREGQVAGRDMLIDIWDIRNCTDPVKLNTVVFPTQSKTFGDPPNELGGPAHNLKFNPSVTKLYGTMPLHEVDLTTWEVRDLQCTIAEQYHETFVASPGLCGTFGKVDHPFGTLSNQPTLGHEPTFSPDGSRLYLGGQQSHQLNGNAMLVVNMEGPEPEVVSITQEAPGHSIDFITVGGRNYLLHSNEIANTSCVHESIRPRTLGFGDRAFILDVTMNDGTEGKPATEEAPLKVSELVLEDSKFDHCGPDTDGPSINTGGPSIAYHDVDDALDSSYAVLNLGPAGFRFFDIRNPQEPVEVAYFNWGESAHTKSYIIPATGHIWVSDADGFRVLELEPQVTKALQLEPPNTNSCIKGGWENYFDKANEPFNNEGDCVSYVAHRDN